MKLQYIVTSSRIWFDVYFECIVSITALFDTMELLRDAGYTLGNIDATVAAERPKLNPHIPEMKRVMADVLQVDVDCLLYTSPSPRDTR